MLDGSTPTVQFADRRTNWELYRRSFKRIHIHRDKAVEMVVSDSNA